jgi:hypothetical protein
MPRFCWRRTQAAASDGVASPGSMSRQSASSEALTAMESLRAWREAALQVVVCRPEAAHVARDRARVGGELAEVDAVEHCPGAVLAVLASRTDAALEVLEVVVLVLSLLGRVVGLVDELRAVLRDELDQLVLGVRGGALAQAVQDRLCALGRVNVGLQIVASALDAALQAVLLVNELL